jgi:branched-subunit amino acid ABC-type transport system permease component
MAMGITFIYGIMRIINWSMGEFYMIGATFNISSLPNSWGSSNGI